MSFTVKFADGNEIEADIVQEAVRKDEARGEISKKLIFKQNLETMDYDILELEKIFSKEDNLSEIQVYDDGEKIAVYTGYREIDGIVNTLQSGAIGGRFVLDIQLSR